MEVLRWDDRFATTLYRANVSYGYAGGCFSRALCMPRGLSNIDLTGTGLRVSENFNNMTRLSGYHNFIIRQRT